MRQGTREKGAGNRGVGGSASDTISIIIIVGSSIDLERVLVVKCKIRFMYIFIVFHPSG
jgi:hypothetical protein